MSRHIVHWQVSELYDTIKYCALHHRTFLFAIFDESGGQDNHQPRDRKLHELYGRAKALFDLVAPQEYGIEPEEKSFVSCISSGFRLMPEFFQRGDWRPHLTPTTPKSSRGP
jgi:Histidine phosphatase superfamily (branch 2)